MICKTTGIVNEKFFMWQPLDWRCRCLLSSLLMSDFVSNQIFCAKYHKFKHAASLLLQFYCCCCYCCLKFFSYYFNWMALFSNSLYLCYRKLCVVLWYIQLVLQYMLMNTLCVSNNIIAQQRWEKPDTQK